MAISRKKASKQNQTADPVTNASEFLPGLAIDAVIFGFHKKQLKILVLEYKNTGLFALPGGFVGIHEDLNKAALRIVAERTGLRNIYLEQFYVFGDRSRHDPKPMKTILRNNKIRVSPDHWLLQRFVSIGFYALIDFTEAVPIPDKMSDHCDWYDLKDLPPMMQDHNKIVTRALDTLRMDLDRRLIAFTLLPPVFTINDLQLLYETILDTRLNRSSFQRRILGLNILDRVDKQYSGGAHKAPYVYKFKRSPSS